MIVLLSSLRLCLFTFALLSIRKSLLAKDDRKEKKKRKKKEKTNSLLPRRQFGGGGSGSSGDVIVVVAVRRREGPKTYPSCKSHYTVTAQRYVNSPQQQQQQQTYRLPSRQTARTDRRLCAQ